MSPSNSAPRALVCLALLAGALQVALAPAQAPAQKPAPGPAQAETTWGVPIGTVLSWWGLEEDVPYGFETCDGRVPTTAGAVYTERKPDLRKKFLRGAEDYRSFLPRAFKGGGSSQLSQLITVSPHALTLAEIPGHAHGLANHTHTNVHSHTIEPHTHAVDDHTHPVGGTIDVSPSGSGVTLIREGGQTALSGPAALAVGATGLTTDPSKTPTGGPSVPDTAFAGGSKSGQPGAAAGHTHALSSANSELLPPYLDVIYIIRVK